MLSVGSFGEHALKAPHTRGDEGDGMGRYRYLDTFIRAGVRHPLTEEALAHTVMSHAYNN